jgi:hypothetical protein
MSKRLALLALALLPAVAHAATATVTIRAYINVSSGCQAATVDYLNNLKARYKPNVKLEMIDFGDRGKGLKRWQSSGYRCMTIELNGSPLVRYAINGQWKYVAFQMPAGFNWTHTDLGQAVAAGLQGQLYAATQAEIEAAAPARQVNATVAVGQVTDHGRRFATVTVNGTPAIYIPGAPADADKRAHAASAALKTWLVRPIKLSQLTVQQVAGGWKVLANGKGVIVATAADGQVYGQQPQSVAQTWVNGLKHTLALATH